MITTTYRTFRFTLLTALFIACLVIGLRFNIDFITFHQAALWACRGLGLAHIYIDRTATLGGKFFYGPVSIPLIEPLGYLPYEEAKWVWLTVQSFSFFVFWWGLTELYPSVRKSFPLWFLAFVVAINPLHNNFQSNNIQLMLVSTLIVAEILSRASHKTLQWLAGALCALAAMVKLFPGFIVLLYLLTKPRRVKEGVLWGSAVWLVVPLLRYGWEPGLALYRDFYWNLFRYHDDNDLVHKQDILCLASLLARLLAGFSQTVFKISYATLALLFAGLYFKLAWNLRKVSDPVVVTSVWALGLAVMAFINPSSLVHYLIFYVPAFCSLAVFAFSPQGVRRGLAASLAISVFLVAFTVEGVVGKDWNNSLEAWNIPTWGLAILCIALFLATDSLKGKLQLGLQPSERQPVT